MLLAWGGIQSPGGHAAPRLTLMPRDKYSAAKSRRGGNHLSTMLLVTKTKGNSAPASIQIPRNASANFQCIPDEFSGAPNLVEITWPKRTPSRNEKSLFGNNETESESASRRFIAHIPGLVHWSFFTVASGRSRDEADGHEDTDSAVPGTDPPTSLTAFRSRGPRRKLPRGSSFPPGPIEVSTMQKAQGPFQAAGVTCCVGAQEIGPSTR